MNKQISVLRAYVPIIRLPTYYTNFEADIDPQFVYQVVSQTFYWIAGIIATAAGLKYLKSDRISKIHSPEITDYNFPLTDNNDPPMKNHQFAFPNKSPKNNFIDIDRMSILLILENEAVPLVKINRLVGTHHKDLLGNLYELENNGFILQKNQQEFVISKKGLELIKKESSQLWVECTLHSINQRRQYIDYIDSRLSHVFCPDGYSKILNDVQLKILKNES